MTDESGGGWQRVSEAFTRALELADDARTAFLAGLEKGEPRVHAQVMDLLAADADLHPGLRPGGLPAPDPGRVPVGSSKAASNDEETDRHIGRRLGPWTVDGFIARGGMGAVYAASRKEEGFAQQAAIKLVDRAWAGPAVMKRFAGERAILAGLEHPAIARLLDGGTTEDGLPWFAMERVRGSSLMTHARESSLGLEDRLRLLIRICDAVDYAHRNLVVHRDLKPGNIMVTEDGDPKLLDFGIARVLESETVIDPALTRTDTRILTPAYASPEQVAGGPVTTATDTYALGLLLYELLTGSRLWGDSRIDAERRQAILTATPPAPSRAPVESGEAPPLDRSRIRGDLDLICLKALRKEPERRYPTAQALARDLLDFLEGRPVAARPDSVGYRVRRWVGRNRAVSAVSAAAVVLLVASSVWYAVGLRAERDRARTQEARATAALGFVTELFRQSDPDIQRNDTIPMGAFLDLGVEELRGQPGDRAPEVRATLLGTLGEIYYRLGRISRADSLLGEAIALRSRVLPAARQSPDPELATLRWTLGRVRFGAGDLESATDLQEAALAARAAALGPVHPGVGDILRSLSELIVMRADPDSGRVLAERAVAIHAMDPGVGSVAHAESQAALASALTAIGDFPGAGPLYESALAALEAEVGDTGPAYLQTLFLFADMQLDGGFVTDAEANFERLIDLETQIYGRRHPRTATSLLSLAQVYEDIGRGDDAEPLVREVLDIRLATLGPEHYQVATAYNQLGLIAEQQGKHAEAADYYRLALETSRFDLGEDHRNRMVNLINLSRAVGRQGDLDTSLEILLEADAMSLRLAPPPNRDWEDVQFALANLYGVMRRYEDAVDIYEVLIPYARETQGPRSGGFLGTLYGYGLILDRLGRWEEVVSIYDEVEAGYAAILDPASWQMARVYSDASRARSWQAARQGRRPGPAELEAWRQRLVTWFDITRDRFGVDDPSHGQATRQLATFDSLWAEGR